MSVLNLSLLGPFTATLQDIPIYNFKTVKVQALFIYLVVERARPHRRERLMELLWPDMPLESAQVNLRQTIYRLRQALPDMGRDSTVVVADRQMVSLYPELEVNLDIEKFQTLLTGDSAAAVDIYRGDFLSDFYLVDSNPFEDWAEAIRVRLREKVLEALDNLTTQSIQAGDYSKARTYAWRQLEIDNLRESAYRQLMVSLSQSGQRSVALAQYQICQQRLKDQLDINPSQETVAIYEQIQAEALRHTKVPLSRPTISSIGDMPIFLLTDIESSTRLWDTYHQAMLPALLRHNAILEDHITRHGGRILELRGDGVKAVFEGVNPLTSMLEIQKAFGTQDWDEIGKLKIRIGLHGVPTIRKGYDYFQKNDTYYGPVLNHTARIMDSAWGGQILVSEQVRNTCLLPEGAYWQDFGLHRVKSLVDPVHIYGLMHPDLPIQAFPPLRTLEAQPEDVAVARTPRLTNLPSQPTPFIGRKTEIDQLVSLLSDPGTRLVTIVGPGGMGKTRLALATAEVFVDKCSQDRGKCAFPDGIVFIPLVSLNDEDQIITALAKTLRIPVDSSQGSENLERTTLGITTLKEKVLGYLETKEILIILDNYEHLLDFSTLVVEIIEAGSAVKVLATSRERLNIREEQVYPLEGLKYPDLGVPQIPGDYTAVTLFIQCARRLLPDFDPDDQDMSDIIHICQLVGGLPLGLEIAASWIGTLSLGDIIQEIKKSYDFLETDLRNIPDRHRSIRAIFDSSWGRLTEIEKQVFARLSIFRGDFSKTAAEKVALASLRHLAHFGNMSLLKFDQENGRYYIHELLRQYGATKLADLPQDKIATQNRFSVFYCEEVEKFTRLYQSGGPQSTSDQIEKDLSNILVAWKWAINHNLFEQIDQALDGICLFFDSRWKPEEGLSLCREALEKINAISEIKQLNGEDTLQVNLIKKIRAKILAWSGFFTLHFHPDQAESLLAIAMSIVDELRDLGIDTRSERVLVLFMQGIMNLIAGNFNDASNQFKSALELSKEIHWHWIVLQILTQLGDVARTSGLPREAKQWYGQCLVEARLQSNPWAEIQALCNLGWAARTMMAYDEAVDYYQKSLELSRLHGNHWEMITSLQSLGFLYLFLGRPQDAYPLFTRTVEKSQEIGMLYRGLSAQVHIGITKWLIGEFDPAESAITKALAIAQDYGTSARIFPTFALVEFLILMGRYEEAGNQIEALKSLIADIFLGPFMEGRFTRILGWFALAQKDYQEAEAQFQLSIAANQQTSDDEQIAWSQAGLARAMMGQGKWESARQLLTEALWTSIEIRGYIPMVFTLPVAIHYLEQTDPQMASTLYQVVQSSPFLANAPFFSDVIYRYLSETTRQPTFDARKTKTVVDTDLWNAAANILSSWIQVWMEAPTEAHNGDPTGAQSGNPTGAHSSNPTGASSKSS